MTKVMFKSVMAFFILLCLVVISGCDDDDSPQNSNIHFTNNTDKEITIKYKQEIKDFLSDSVSVENKSELIPIGEKRTLAIQESFWLVSFTIVYDNLEFDEAISVNFIGGDEDYNVTLESLGLVSNG